MSKDALSAARLQLGRVNIVLLASAIISLAVGYYLLAQGDTGLAPVLLVLGYCVLFPLGLAL